MEEQRLNRDQFVIARLKERLAALEERNAELEFAVLANQEKLSGNNADKEE